MKKLGLSLLWLIAMSWTVQAEQPWTPGESPVLSLTESELSLILDEEIQKALTAQSAQLIREYEPLLAEKDQVIFELRTDRADVYSRLGSVQLLVDSLGLDVLRLEATVKDQEALVDEQTRLAEVAQSVADSAQAETRMWQYVAGGSAVVAVVTTLILVFSRR